MKSSFFTTLKTIFYSLLIASLTLLVLELGFRLSGHKPANRSPFGMEFTRPDPKVGFRAQANAKWWVDMTPYGAFVARYYGGTDANGYRPTIFNSWNKNAKTLVALGDSMTFGIESSNDTTWPELLARRLTEQGKPYQVKNISYRGWGTLQQAIALEEYAAAGGKADAVLLMVVTNDPTDNIGRYYYPSAPIISEENGQLKTIPPLDSPELNQMDRVWRNEKWIRKSALATYFYRKGGANLIGEEHELSNFDLSDESYQSIFWNPEAYETLNVTLKSLSATDKESVLKQKAFLFALQKLKAVCDKMGSKLIITTTAAFPVKNGKNAKSFQNLLKMSDSQFNEFAATWAKHQHDVATYAQKIGASYIDNSTSLDALDFRQYAAQPIDWHSSTEANVFQSRALANELISKNLIP